MKRLAGTTRGRLVVLSTAALAAAVLIADVGLSAWLTFSQRSELDGQLQRQAETVGAGLEVVSGQVSFRGRPLPGETDQGVAADTAVVGPAGVLTQGQAQPLTAATLREVAAPVLRTGRPIWVDLVDAHRVQRRVYAAPVQVGSSERAALVVSSSVRQLQDTRWQIMAVLGLLSVTVVALGGLLAHWLAGRILRPVHDIASLAATLSQLDLHRRVDVSVPDDELGELVGTFNGMLGRLESSFQTLRSFTADAAHELRTPLTLMSTELEVTLSRSRSAAEHRDALGLLSGEVQHLIGIVESLLFLARADAGQLRPAVEQLDVVDLVHDAVARWSDTAAGRGVRLEETLRDTGTVPGDSRLVRRILDNLIDNAIRYSPRSGRVRVEAGRASEGWLFAVSDEGPGVPGELRSSVFSRFVRGDPARTRGGGTGLGLALSRTAARAQGGDLRLVETTSGARFELTLPTDRAPAAGARSLVAGGAALDS